MSVALLRRNGVLTVTIVPIGACAEAAFIAGFVVAEGSFVTSSTPSKTRFFFAVSLGATDAPLCDDLQQFFGCGTIHSSPRRQPHYDDEVRFQIADRSDLLNRLIPFMDEHLPPSYKRLQYEAWREKLLHYREFEARRPRSCEVDGCDRTRRAKGLCRDHYYAQFGR